MISTKINIKSLTAIKNFPYYLSNMRAASSTEIKAKLKKLSQPELLEICMRLARFKKENKELLTFQLFESDDITAFINNSKEEITASFASINKSNLYWAKKSLRKILRDTNKLVRYAGDKQVEIELLLHYCSSLRDSGIAYPKSPALFKLYLNLLKKIRLAIETMHEDLQYDYLKDLDQLTTD
jgi:hypothetical protein